MTPIRWIVLLVALLISTPAVAQDGADLLRKGDYDGAATAYQSALDADGNDGVALLGMADLHIRRGDLDAADSLLTSAEKIGSLRDEARVRRAEILALRGDYAGARRTFKSLVAANQDNHRAMVGLGRMHQTLGDYKDARRTMETFVSVYNSAGELPADTLTYVGIATRELDYFEDANAVFSEASGVDPQYIDAWLEAGALYIEKYNWHDAFAMFETALGVDPNHPDAHAGVARIYLEERDFKAARAAVEKAFEANPNHLGAYAVSIALEMSDENPSGALELIERALAVNPRSLEILSLSAAAHYVNDDVEATKAAEKATLAVNPTYAPLYGTMAEFGEMVHRYEEGIVLYNKALELNPEYWEAFVGLGIAYTRAGNDDEGRKYIDKAHANDPYNVRAFNMARLYDETLPNYEFVHGDHLRYRFHRDEREVLELYVVPLLDEAFDIMVKKYAFTPEKPVSIEVLQDITSFSVRSIGLPLISAQGICFGKLVTARSPAEGNFNWAQTLWHELAHVFHIQLSENRVPRWFTEGLAEYETIVTREPWRREYDMEIFQQLERGALLGVDELNKGFTQAESINQIVVAYYQASLVIEYIDETYGFAKLPEMLRAWAERKKQPEVFTTVLGVTTTAFDAGFEAWLGERLSFLGKSFELDVDRYIHRADEVQKDLDADPENADRIAESGFVALFQGNVDGAKGLAESAMAKNPESPHALYLTGVIALRSGDFPTAGKTYNKMISLGHDGYTIRVELGYVCVKLGDTNGALQHYEKAKSFFPNGEEPYRELAEYYMGESKHKEAYAEYAALALINQNDFQVARKAMDLATELGDRDGAMAHAELALDIYPFDHDVHHALAAFAVEKADWALVVREYQAYLVVKPQRPFPAYIGLARAYLEIGDKEAARDWFERARAVNPDAPELAPLESRF